MTFAGPAVLLGLVGWLAVTALPVGAAVLAVLAWRTRLLPFTAIAAALTALTLLIAAVVPHPAPSPVVAVATLAALVTAVCGGSPAVRLLLDRTAFGEPEGAHGGILVGDRELLRGGEVIGLLERLAVAGAIVAGVPEALAVIIAIKGVGRFTELDNAPARERFIVGTLTSWIWASAAAGLVLLTR